MLIVKGTVHHGGLTVGLLANDAWHVQQNVTRPGPFCLAIPVESAGTYTVIVANNVADTSLRTDCEITDIGWGQVGPDADLIATKPSEPNAKNQ